MGVPRVVLDVPGCPGVALDLDRGASPGTVDELVGSLPFDVGLNVWGDEIYTEPAPVSAAEENPRSLVDLYDVAYWPPGRAICLFYGPTPIGGEGEIRPYSPVNVIGRIVDPDRSVLGRAGGATGTFRRG